MNLQCLSSLDRQLARLGRELTWMRTLSKGYGIPTTYCIAAPTQAKEMAYRYRHMLQQAESANAEGCKLSVQVRVKPQGILMCWESSSHPFVECPTFLKLWREGWDPYTHQFKKKTELWRDMSLKRRIIKEAYDLIRTSGHGGNIVSRVGPKTCVENSRFLFKLTDAHETHSAESAEMEAVRRECQVLEVLYDWMCEQNGTQVVVQMNTHDSIDGSLVHPVTIPGVASFLCNSTSPTYLLTHWFRRTGKLPLELAVKLHSHDTARVYSLNDRGTLQVGKIADINVINLSKLDIRPPRFVCDLPTGAGRWIQEVTGYDYTIKTGLITFVNGRPTGCLPGRVVSGPGFQTHASSTHGAYNGTIMGNLRMALSKLRWQGQEKVLDATIKLWGYKQSLSKL